MFHEALNIGTGFYSCEDFGWGFGELMKKTSICQRNFTGRNYDKSKKPI
jgi:hypothetical protein